MADVDHAHAAIPQLPDHCKQPLGVRLRQAARRLVHDQHPRLGPERARDLDHLLLGDRETPGRPVEVEVLVPELRQRGGRAGPRLRPPHPAQPLRLGPQHDVLRHAQVRREAQLLVNHRDAVTLRVERVDRRVRLSVQLGRAGVRPQGAAEDVHQRALARAVLADHRVHLAHCDLERHPAQGEGRAEGLRHAGQPQARR